MSEDGDLPQEAWAFLERHKFFVMIIPKRYVDWAFPLGVLDERPGI